MSFTFRLQTANVPAGQQCLSTLGQVLTAVAKYVTVTGPDGVTALIVSKQQPTIEDRDKPWLKLSDQGNLLSFNFYNGEWKPFTALPVGVIALHSGLLSDIPAGWKIATGADGSTKNLTSLTGLWAGGNGGNAGNYSGSATLYLVCPIEFVGLP